MLSAATGLGPLLTKKDSSRVCLPAVEHLFSRSMTLSTRAYGAGVGSEGRGLKGRGVKGVEKKAARWRLVERVPLHKEGAEPRHVGSAPAQLHARRVHHLLRVRARVRLRLRLRLRVRARARARARGRAARPP